MASVQPTRASGLPVRSLRSPILYGMRHMRFFAVFALVALAEMATFFWVESRIGLGPALLLALATALIGSVLVRRAGVSVFRQIQNKISSGEMPGRELTHGAAILVAGAFLISPGFLTDTLGFLLLVPAIRDVIHGYVSKRLSARVKVVTPSREGGDVIDVEGWE